MCISASHRRVSKVLVKCRIKIITVKVPDIVFRQTNLICITPDLTE